jgi:hypothetical protein
MEHGNFYKKMAILIEKMDKRMIVNKRILNSEKKEMTVLKMMKNQISQMMMKMMIMDLMKMEKMIVKVLIGMNLIEELMKMIKRQLKRDNNKIKNKGIK